MGSSLGTVGTVLKCYGSACQLFQNRVNSIATYTGSVLTQPSRPLVIVHETIHASWFLWMMSWIVKIHKMIRIHQLTQCSIPIWHYWQWIALYCTKQDLREFYWGKHADLDPINSKYWFHLGRIRSFISLARLLILHPKQNPRHFGGWK